MVVVGAGQREFREGAVHGVFECGSEAYREQVDRKCVMFSWLYVGSVASWFSRLFNVSPIRLPMYSEGYGGSQGVFSRLCSR